MKKALLSLIFITFLLPAKKAKAIYNPANTQNNKFGVHIFSPEEIEKAAELVNSNGGSWGYVTVPIQPEDRDKQKWQLFMQKTRELNIIPILRITTIPKGGEWAQGKDTDLVDFANFLSELDWPTQNHYIIIFNEVNRAQEWGGKVDPEKYAKILKNSYNIFKERSQNFFILPAGLDSSLPNSDQSLSTHSFLTRMSSSDSDVFDYIDGWTSHSYPNPDFSASPYKTGIQSITGYKQELEIIKKNLPVFITETGWKSSKLKEETVYNYYQIAWQKWLSDNNVIAVTPFVLQSSSTSYPGFSFLDEQGNPNSKWKATEQIKKIKGEPKINQTLSDKLQKNIIKRNPISTQPYFQKPSLLLELERLFLKLIVIFDLNQAPAQ